MGTGIHHWVSWYQRKIGTYDKQQWECTVEQRILHGLSQVPRKSARLKTELIDVDLVRGSSFPKAKPKHGLGTVARLGLQRLILLPAYSRWWIEQTSAQVFALLLGLYFLQLFNMILFFLFAPADLANYAQEDGSEPASTSDVLVPAFMMIILSVIHSQVVSTHGAISPQSHRSLRKRKLMKRRLPQMRAKPISETRSSQDEDFEKECLLQVKTSSPTKQSFDSRKVSKNGGRDWIRKRKPVENRVAGPGAGLPVDDDGFESLNGNGSSDEPTVANQDLCDKDISKSANLSLERADVTQHSQSNSNNSSDNLDHKPTVIIDGEDCDLTSDRDYKSTLENSADSSVKVNELRTTSNWGDEEPLIPFSLPPKIEDAFETQLSGDQVSNSNLLQRRRSAPLSRLRRTEKERTRDFGPRDFDSDGPVFRLGASSKTVSRRRGSYASVLPGSVSSARDESSVNSSCCDSDEDRDRRGAGAEDHEGSSVSSPVVSTSAAEWVGITTNSEDCSVSSEVEEQDAGEPREQNEQPFAWEFEVSPAVIMYPGCTDKVSCTIWENRDVKKADLSVLDISSAIIARVEAMPDNLDYFYGGMIMGFILGLVPAICRLTSAGSVGGEGGPFVPLTNSSTLFTSSVTEMSQYALEHVSTTVVYIMNVAFGETLWERTVMVICVVERWAMASLFLFLLAVAERTFKQRFLYAKLFSHLTSFRRARKSELPHFRLNKVRNIKTWLSVRSYLKKRGPQRSVDMVVSAAFIITLLLLSFLSVELLKDSLGANSQYNVEALCWCLVLVVFLLRFMTLGTKINSKYRNLAVLITEQINLYLQIEQKPNKKDELMVANSVLKLAADLIKELESPFKISGLSANPYLYNITKVVILSALSGVLSEILGFKLKLHKIKIK